MLKLAIIEYFENHHALLKTEAIEEYRRHMPSIWQDGTGWLTVEPTPGTINYNPRRKCAKVMFYEHEPRTRRGYYVKLQVLPNNQFRSA